MTPKIRYAKSGDVNIAYTVTGEGPLDLVFVPGWVSHVEALWELPLTAQFFERLSSFARLILFDKRGTGLSDRVPVKELPTLEERMDDVRAVMDAVGSERAVIFGLSEGGPMALLFAATYPERTSALALFGTFAKPDFVQNMMGQLDVDFRQFEKTLEEKWAEGWPGLEIWAPSIASIDGAQEAWARGMRAGASPAAAIALIRMVGSIDVRDILSSIHVPTVIMHREGDRAVGIGCAREMAELMPEAKLVEFPGEDHVPWVGDTESVIGEVEELVTGARQDPITDRVLATVLFTDIVASTERAVEMGDRSWGELLAQHHSLVRRELDRFRGCEVDTAGDGFFVTFDGPARGIQCAKRIRDAVRPLGIEIRAGLHTGECECSGEKVAGIAVHIGSRVMSSASAGEVVVSGTTHDLVVGSGLEFDDRDVHALKGVPGEWRLFSVN